MEGDDAKCVDIGDKVGWLVEESADAKGVDAKDADICDKVGWLVRKVLMLKVLILKGRLIRSLACL